MVSATGDVVIWRHGPNHENFLSSFPTSSRSGRPLSPRTQTHVFSRRFLQVWPGRGRYHATGCGSLKVRLCISTLECGGVFGSAIRAPLCAICSVRRCRVLMKLFNNVDGDISGVPPKRQVDMSFSWWPSYVFALPRLIALAPRRAIKSLDVVKMSDDILIIISDGLLRSGRPELSGVPSHASCSLPGSLVSVEMIRTQHEHLPGLLFDNTPSSGLQHPSPRLAVTASSYGPHV
ncbi:hypothetical protein QBC40DRAFT_298220 [Triangularia verruculosa]|uniref:Uncharacterized protein n=1 Tax=Triangularia verruculosa TaxID=2587418 RepID=A0AAN6XFV4_9PEZI|nr:hypothetical protein QBC40DRAFT_298220 [Triangularia verruculosa]